MTTRRRVSRKATSGLGRSRAPRGKSREPSEEEDDVVPQRRPVWTGSVSFGLLQIPVSLHSAESPRTVHFRQLDSRDMQPIGYQRINKTTGKVVAWSDIVRGFPIEGTDHHVAITDEELDAVAVEATQTIDIQDFVEAAEIDPTYFETPYYLAPTKKSEKAYALLREALKKTRKVAVATIVIRTRESLAAIIPHGDVLVLETLRFAHELRNTDDLPVPARDLASLRVTAREISMAERLVEDMTATWEPEKYKDSYYDAVVAMAEEKAKNGKVTHVRETTRREVPSNVIDIVRVLERSLAGSRNGKTRPLAKTGKRTTKKVASKHRAA